MGEIREYSWSFNENADVWTSGTFDTIAECIADAKGENAIDGNRHAVVYIGTNIPFKPSANVESMLENMEEQAADEVGEVGQDWNAYDYKKREELDELQEAVQKVVDEWMLKYGYYPGLYTIAGITSYPLDERSVDHGEGI